MTTKVETSMVKAGFASVAQLQDLRDLFVGMTADFHYVPQDPWWVPLFGQTLNVADYPKLAAKIGVVGATFVLPDCRGRVRAGRDNMGGISADRLTGLAGGLNGDNLGASGGVQSHVLTLAQLAEHNHGGETGQAGAFTPRFRATASTTAITTPPNVKFLAGDADTGTYYSGPVEAVPNHAHSVPAAGSGEAHNNVQPTIIFITCVLAY